MTSASNAATDSDAPSGEVPPPEVVYCLSSQSHLCPTSKEIKFSDQKEIGWNQLIPIDLDILCIC